MLDACERMGFDADGVAARAGVDRAELRDPDARLAPRAIERVWREAYATTADPCLALHAAEHVPDGAYRVLDYLAAASATLGEAIERLVSYFPLVGGVALQLERSADGVALWLRDAVADAVVPLPAQQYTLAAIVLRTRRGCGVAWTPTHVDFTEAVPAPDDHARIFGVLPRANRPRPGFGIAHADWQRPCARADAGLATLLEAHAADLVARLPEGGGTARDVATAVASTLGEGEPSLAAIAKRLHTSARTLQRRLDDEGTSLAAIVRAQREHAARRYLQRREMSLVEIAWLLGFSDQSAFTRAFRRWTGVTPARFREGASA
ncbi:MAG: AraC family transcriptional regulator [Nannocystaceae bacterium]|nr:AraC family transcriptional regulator [Nannocystaceae bacterium]